MLITPRPISPVMRGLAAVLAVITLGVATFSCDGDDDWTPNDKGFSGNPHWRK